MINDNNYNQSLIAKGYGTAHPKEQSFMFVIAMSVGCSVGPPINR